MKKLIIYLSAVIISAVGFYGCSKSHSEDSVQTVSKEITVASGGGNGINYSISNDWIKFTSIQDWLALFSATEAQQFEVYNNVRSSNNFVSTMDIWMDTLGTSNGMCVNFQDTKDNADSVFNPIFASFLNQDGIVQIGDYIFKIDQVQKRCLALNESNISQIANLRNGLETGNIQKFVSGSDVIQVLYGTNAPGSGNIYCDPGAYERTDGEFKDDYTTNRRIRYAVAYKNNFLHRALSARCISQKKGAFGIWTWQNRNMTFSVYKRKYKIACGVNYEPSTTYPYNTGNNPVLWPWRNAIIYDDAYVYNGDGGEISKYWWDGKVVLIDWNNYSTRRMLIKQGY